MFNPVATYRIQFHKDFTLAHLEQAIPYLHQLGVTTIYASPVFESVPGSTHGYDGVNPHRINPEIGTEEQLKKISKQLKELGMKWLQDIVPNHMAYHPNNQWLMDVLEKGPESEYASFFDVSWNSGLHHGRLMAPFLGATLPDVIKNGELKVAYEGQRLVFKYYDSSYPLQARSYTTILNGDGVDASDALRQLLAQMPKEENAKAYGLAWKEFLARLAAIMSNGADKEYIDRRIGAINADLVLLHAIEDEQSYRLCHWQETDHHINYRRFFTVNGLICLNIQDQNVFEQYHSYIKQLTGEGIFSGLRVDHIDGLHDPEAYLQQLRELAGQDVYIVVEKILETGEELPGSWPIEGNTGYDFLALVNNLFTKKSKEKLFTREYEKIAGKGATIAEQVYRKKAHILHEHMGGELDNLYTMFAELRLAGDSQLSEPEAANLKAAIGELMVQCPVYRYYGNNLPLAAGEEAALQKILERITARRPELEAAVALLANVLFTNIRNTDKDYNSRALSFYQRMMQFTGPLMAKGVEDTLMYTYNRFVGHNDVGDSPESFGISKKDFHEKMVERQRLWPLSINGTSTHDTKRGEDVRARLNVMTDIADEWFEAIHEWRKLNEDLKQDGMPTANDEYFIYQTLIGSYSMHEEEQAGYGDRIKEYLQKALREAKTNSNWTTPNEAYEKAAQNFAVALLDKDKPFWHSFKKLYGQVADAGITNSLSQVLLKFTCPGVPDVYQGCELWDLSLVDPDNRRPVDYKKRNEVLGAFDTGKDKEERAKELWESKNDARIKLWLTHTLLQERKENTEAFLKGHYIPLLVKGKHSDHVFAFARHYQDIWYIVAVPLHTAALAKDEYDALSIDWAGTHIVLPNEAPKEWVNVLFQKKGKTADGIEVQKLFASLPFALLKMHQPATERAAGVLMHITSLPSPYGIGDFGPEAKLFADFLIRSNQKYWQLLPLSPIEKESCYSPYSSISTMAGNGMLLSPDLLALEGLISHDDLKRYHTSTTDKTDYDAARQAKDEIFELAYSNFCSQPKAAHAAFESYCKKESYWLHDFALYAALKDAHGRKPWNEWEDKYKNRDTSALKEFEQQHGQDLDKIKWLQWQVAKQWGELRAYCNNAGIKLFGDLPFYVSADSADVWANREIFSLDKQGNTTGIAGVPPDYFSEDGQLWGMPTYNWDALKEKNYSWWVTRLRKNLELFDVLRLDHFRALACYWDVPAGEDTARHGTWKPGPGKHFFDVLQKELGDIPFIAEDLGDNMADVYKLRDEVHLPGMKVLQFAFGDNMPQSVDAPHNYTKNFVVYTGTHDNNTAQGWYKQESGKAGHKRLEAYLDTKVTAKNVHLVLGRMAYASVAKIAIIPMQDILGLDDTTRMNTPGSAENNWLWRLQPGQTDKHIEQQLRDWVKLYNR